MEGAGSAVRTTESCWLQQEISVWAKRWNGQLNFFSAWGPLLWVMEDWRCLLAAVYTQVLSNYLTVGLKFVVELGGVGIRAKLKRRVCLALERQRGPEWFNEHVLLSRR